VEVKLDVLACWRRFGNAEGHPRATQYRRLAKIIVMPDVKEQLLGQGVYAAAPTTAPSSRPSGWSQEVARWAKLINETNIKSDD